MSHDYGVQPIQASTSYDGRCGHRRLKCLQLPSALSSESSLLRCMEKEREVSDGNAETNGNILSGLETLEEQNVAKVVTQKL